MIRSCFFLYICKRQDQFIIYDLFNSYTAFDDYLCSLHLTVVCGSLVGEGIAMKYLVSTTRNFVIHRRKVKYFNEGLSRMVLILISYLISSYRASLEKKSFFPPNILMCDILFFR